MRRELLAELIGTYILVFAGTGAIIIETLTGAMGHVGIAMTFGLVVTVLVYTLGHISGAHFNPAVSIAFTFMHELEKKRLLPYIAVQLIGAILASLTLYLLFMEEAKSMAELSYLGATLPHGSEMQSFVLEFILTFILMFVIVGSAVHEKAVKSFAGIAIGATVGLEAMFAGPICGASMNPARSISPALVSGNFEHLWLYVVATILGAVCAVWVNKYIR
jgi:aquaporin NIP